MAAFPHLVYLPCGRLGIRPGDGTIIPRTGSAANICYYVADWLNFSRNEASYDPASVSPQSRHALTTAESSSVDPVASCSPSWPQSRHSLITCASCPLSLVAARDFFASVSICHPTCKLAPQEILAVADRIPVSGGLSISPILVCRARAPHRVMDTDRARLLEGGLPQAFDGCISRWPCRPACLW